MARRAAAATLMRRLLPSTGPLPRVFCSGRSCGGGGDGEVDRSKPPYNMISFLGDWYLTEEALKHPGKDYQHWFVQISKPSKLLNLDNRERIDYFAHILRAVDLSEGSRHYAAKIYKVVCEGENQGFGCKVDWSFANKIKYVYDVAKVSPDYYPDPKYKDYGGELVVNGKIVERRSEREPNTEQVAP